MPNEDWQQRKYEEVLEQMCLHVERQRRADPNFTVEQLEGLLKTAYVNQGNDWTGKGAVSDIVQSATIAAYEHILAEWRKPLASERSE